MALTLELACSSSFFLLQASSWQSKYTSEVKRLFLPSGDHIPPSASVEMLVIFCGLVARAPLPESKLAIQICELPSRLLVKLIWRPSGEKRPRSSPAASLVNCLASPPATATSHRCGVFLLAWRFTSTAENSTHLPSGETCGPPTRLSAIMSSNVKGRLPVFWASTERLPEGPRFASEPLDGDTP